MVELRQKRRRMSSPDRCERERERGKGVRRRETEVWLPLAHTGQICGTMLGTSESHTGNYVSLRERRRYFSSEQKGRVNI